MQNRKLNVAIVVGIFPSISETFILNQILYLIQQGHKVTILAYSEGNKEKIHEEIKKYNLLNKCLFYYRKDKGKVHTITTFFKMIVRNFPHLDYGLLLQSLNFFKYGKDALLLNRFFEAQFFIPQNNFDLIHVHFADNALPIVNLFKEKRIKKIPLIVSFHGYDLRPDLLNSYITTYKYLFNYTEEFTVNGPYLYSLLTSIHKKENISILQESLDTNKFTRNRINKEENSTLKIIFCGRLIPFKAPNLTVDIIDELVNKRNYKNICLHIIGDGILRKEIEEKIQEKNLDRYIKILGALTQETVFDEFNTADIFLLPGIHEPGTNRAETQGLVIQEAQSMQLPVVVSDAGGMKDGLLDNITGFVVKEKDVIGFADKLELLIKSPNLRKQMGIAGREFVIENFDKEILGKRLVEIYKTVLDKIQ